MKVVLDYLTDYVNRCSSCKLGRSGECSWMKQYKDAAEKIVFKGDETSESRIITLSGIIATEACEEQLSFDEYVSGADTLLTGAEIPTTYDGLRRFFSGLRSLSLRRNRFSKQLLPLLGDLVGVGCEHCLAQIDYAYLTWGFDIEKMLVDAFPSYRRSDIFENCNYSPLFVSQAVKHADALGLDEMEILGTLMPQGRDDLGIGIPLASLPGGKEPISAVDSILPEEQLIFLRPYLKALAEKGYCDENYQWINTKKTGGHAYTQAAWIIHVLAQMNTDLIQYKVGAFMGIQNLCNYFGRVTEVAPYKETIRRLFREAELPFEGE